MNTLPVCRHRGKEITPGRYHCHSPKVLVSSAGVTAELCRGCYYRDHEDTGPPPSNPRSRACRFLGRRVRDENGDVKTVDRQSFA
jgi:hypothetical protein